MTEEQYKQALSVNHRISLLEEVKDEIKTPELRSLTFCADNGTICRFHVMKNISDILDKHDAQIRKEIDYKIKQLKESIKEI